MYHKCSPSYFWQSVPWLTILTTLANETTVLQLQPALLMVMMMMIDDADVDDDDVDEYHSIGLSMNIILYGYQSYSHLCHHYHCDDEV